MIFRDARRTDVPEIVALLTDDPLGRGREGRAPAAYLAAFDEIEANPMHHLIVAEDAGSIIGCCQLTLLSGLSRGGARRALVEAVRVAPEMRSRGIGARLMAECEARARAGGAVIIQLTTDKSRKRAHEFYARLGYDPSHVGYKKPL
jgi:N-acetylglutamate synthase-like GNAT family acetyltransferase